MLQAVPALRALRALTPGARVVFAGQPRLGRLLAGTGVADEALASDGLGLESLFAPEPLPAHVRARLARFDRAVSWFAAGVDPYPAQLSLAIPDVVLGRPVPQEVGLPVWQHLLDTLEPWGRPVPNMSPLAVPARWRDDGRAARARVGASAEGPLFVLHPGAGADRKRWASERFAEVATRVARSSGCSLLVHQGPADALASSSLERALGHAPLRLVEPELPTLAGLLATADVYLGSDSGVSHLAASVGVPSAILYPAATLGTWRPWSATAMAIDAATPAADPAAVADLLIAALARGGPGASVA